MGDPAGIGPELCLRALRDPGLLRRCVPVLFGDAGVVQRLRKSWDKSSSKTGNKSRTRTGMRDEDENCRVVSLAEWEKLGRSKEPLIVDCAAIDAAKIKPGAKGNLIVNIINKRPRQPDRAGAPARGNQKPPVLGTLPAIPFAIAAPQLSSK